MASVHLVGELLGASGLACQTGHVALSVAHVLDFLSLHPSSELSYFCKWRLVVDSPDKSSRENPTWKVVQGETSGQTQVHEALSGGSLAMPDLYRHSSDTQERVLLPRMDTVWAHPIDLHLAVACMDSWNCWPKLEFQIWSSDRFQLETLCGRASIHLPLVTNEYVLDSPIVLQEPGTILESLLRSVGLPFQEKNKQSSDTSIRGTGMLYLRLAVLTRGLAMD